MKIFIRIVLIVFALFLAFVGIGTIYTAFNAGYVNTICRHMIQAGEANYLFMAFMILMALIFIISAVILFILSFKAKPEETYVVTATEMGEIRISFETLRNIVFNSLTYNEELSNTKVALNKDEEGVGILVSADIKPDIVIPDLAGRMQVEIKNAVERSTGVPVKDVRVNVERVSAQQGGLDRTVKTNF